MVTARDVKSWDEFVELAATADAKYPPDGIENRFTFDGKVDQPHVC